MRRIAPLVLLCLAACSPPAEPYLDLLEATRHAESISPTRLIDLGTAAGRAHLGQGWSIQDELWAGNWPFVWATEKAATVYFNSRGGDARAVRFRCAPPQSIDESQTVTLLLNRAPQGTVSLRPGFHPQRVRVDAAAVRPGKNRLDLVFRDSAPPTGEGTRWRSAACDWIRIVHDDELPGETGRAEVVDGKLRIPAGTRLEYHVDLRPDSVLSLSGVDREGLPGTAGLRVDVRTVDGRRQRIEVEGSSLAGNKRLALELTGPAALSLEPTGTITPGGSVRIAEATLVGAVHATPDAAELAGAETALEGTSPSVLVYMIDTLRADHLGSYGYHLETSPRIDAFADEAIVFDRMFAQSGWTRTSIASLMTGLLPPSHSAYGREDKLSAAARTLPGELREHGYETFGVITNGIVSPAFGFDQGFDRYEYLGERSDERIHRYSGEVNDAFLEWVDRRDDGRPFFAYLHTMDVHSPYTPPEPYRTRFAPDHRRTDLRFPRHAKAFAARHEDFTEEQVRDDLVALYDAEIAHNDQSFGELLDALRDRGLYDDLVIVLLSDHGEEFLDHGRYEHLKTLYREIVHVPLIVKLPESRNGGTRTEATAQHVDVMPTLLQLAGADVPEWAQGTSLLPALEEPGESWRPRRVRSYMQVDGADVSSFIQGRWHLVRRPMVPDSMRTLGLELYDLDGDPDETRNLAHELPIRAGLLMTSWTRAEAQDIRLLDAETATIDEELRDRLRALGYLR